MSRTRTLLGLEYVTAESVRLELDDDGWRLVKPRLLGERLLVQAREFLEKVETTLPPPRDDGKPHTLLELGEFAATTFGMRCTHRRFKQNQ